jgi:hypothetical protein
MASGRSALCRLDDFLRHNRPETKTFCPISVRRTTHGGVRRNHRPSFAVPIVLRHTTIIQRFPPVP